ncbi:MAG: hypothetical protein WCJ69_18030 [Betaproteobacteria bacterium]
MAIDANRYSVPFGLIGKTVQVTREADQWVIRHGGKVVAEHAVLGARHGLSVKPEHGPGALPRNQRQRFAAGGERAVRLDPDEAVEKPADAAGRFRSYVAPVFGQFRR